MTATVARSADREPISAPRRQGGGSDEGGDRTSRSGSRPTTIVWWREVIMVVALYCAYSFVRSLAGRGAVDAFGNAVRILDLEQRLGMANELAIQQWFLQWPTLVWAMNVAYGMLHFVVPITVLVVLGRRVPQAYRRALNTLVATTTLGLVGFALFPLMPPRLLCACAGGAGVDYGYVDTLDRFGGLWTFGSHTATVVSNQYAAMPSLHVAWALWCLVVVWPLTTNRLLRLVVVAYPALTLLIVVVTANHFWLDAVGGAAVLAAGYGVAAAIERISVRSDLRSRVAQRYGWDSPPVVASPSVARSGVMPVQSASEAIAS